MILVLLVRPERPLRPRARRRWSACERPLARGARRRRGRSSSRRRCSAASSRRSTEGYFVNTLVNVSIVVALYVFIGNSGVLSFGHISFVAVGAWTAGVLSVPVGREAGDHAEPRPLPRATTPIGNVPSLLVAGGVGGLYALLVGLPLMRLSGLAAGIATFARARDHPQRAPLLREDRARIEHVLVGARDDRPAAGHARRAARDRGRVRLPASRYGRLLRATREDSAAARAVGVSVYRQRLDRVHALGRARGVRRRALRASAADQHGVGLPRSDLHHPGDARDRGHDESLGRGRRRAGGQRPRLAARRGGERPRRRRLHDRPARGHAPRRRRHADGTHADPAAERHHRRSRAATRPPPTNPSTQSGRDPT